MVFWLVRLLGCIQICSSPASFYFPVLSRNGFGCFERFLFVFRRKQVVLALEFQVNVAYFIHSYAEVDSCRRRACMV